MICDVSKHQGKIDWGQLGPQLDFVIIKASGLYENGADPQYAANVAGAVRMKVPFHVYHFLYCTTEAEAKRDAALFYNTVKAQGHMPLFWVLDCEAGWGIANNRARPVAEAFEMELRRLAGTDIRVAIYVAQEKYYSYALDYDHYAYVWIPGYGDKYKPQMPCDIWQYTSDGNLPGISGNVDLNVLSGTKPMEYFTRPLSEPVLINGTDNEKKELKGGEKPMFTGIQLAAYCEKVYKAKWVYWYGTYGKKCTQSLYESKKKQYPSHYGSSRTKGYMRDISEGRWCADCVGMIKSFFWTGGQFETTPKYATNGCPDVSANGMIKLCSETGKIGTIPDEPGLVVWKDGHIGVYVGGGYTVEMKGFDYDCRRNKVSSGPWTKWGRLPKSMITYTDAPADEPKPSVLKKGSKGETVRELQEDLLSLGYKLPKYGADGDFGSETEKAVKEFQSAVGLPVTGIVDAATLAAIDTAIEDGKESLPSTQMVKITGGSVNVRSGPGTSGTRILGVVKQGDKLPYQDEEREVDGRPWYLVDYNGKNGWVSSKYSRIEG